MTIGWTACTLQAQATKLGQPVVEGCEVQCELKGLDVLPLLSASAAEGHLGLQSRLKVKGSADFSGRVTPATTAADGSITTPSSFAGAPALCSKYALEVDLGLRRTAAVPSFVESATSLGVWLVGL